MKKYKAIDLLAFTTEKLNEFLTGEFILVFQDGEVITNYKDVVYSSYTWDFIREYPNTPLLTKHLVTTVLNGKKLNSNTHLTLLGNVAKSIYDTYVQLLDKSAKEIFEDQEHTLRDNLCKRIYEITNVMYVELSHSLEEYVTSLDILDFIEVLDHPSVKETNTHVQSLLDGIPNNQLVHYCISNRNKLENEIGTTYGVIKDILGDVNVLPNNAVSHAVQAKTAKLGQVLQCLGPRGFVTDIDSNQFPVPILRGYTEGIRLYRDLFIESRSAAKSLSFSKSQLQQAEYFSRRLQLMSQVVKNLHTDDCGSTKYLTWHVKGEVRDGDEVIRKSDLGLINGKYYVTDDGSLAMIKKTDKHLIGKTLKLRSVLHCSHKDPYGVCSTCFGELSFSVPRNTNLGQYTSTSLASKSSQNVLSTKHLDGSSSIESITLDKESSRYLEVSKDGNSYLLNPKMEGRYIRLVLPASSVGNISDIYLVEDVERLNITRVSEIHDVSFLTMIQEDEINIPIELSLGKRLASMTYSLLKHIKVHGYITDDVGNYIIDLTKWDVTKPLFTLPLRHISMSDHSNDLAEIIESSVDELQARDTVISPEATLVELFNLTNERLDVNLAVLEVVIYATMVVSIARGDYSLPKTWTESSLGVMRDSMQQRSLSALMAYQGHKSCILSRPNSFLQTNRVDHLFDNILLPGVVPNT